MPQPPHRVLHVAKSLGLGGTEKVLQILTTGLDRSKFQPVVFAVADGPRREIIQAAGVEVRVGPDLYSILNEVSPALIHIHRGGWPEPTLMRPVKLYQADRKRRGLPAAAVVETNVFGRRDETPAADLFDTHLFVSGFCLHRYGRVYGVDVSTPRHQVLYNPVDTDFYEANTPAPPFGKPIFGRISRADPGKWSPLALECLQHLAPQMPDYRYRIVGAIPEAERMVAGHGLQNRVEFLPPLTSERELADYYGSITCLAHANDTGESFGLVIAEAMAAGLPVVTHPCPGLRDNAQLELVDHGRTGLVAETAQEFGQALAWLLSNPDQARQMGQRGREKARELYRKQTVVQRLMTIYDRLLQEKKINHAPPRPAEPAC